MYNIPEVKKILRGTIRYKGYCEIVACFLDLGLLEIDELKEKNEFFGAIDLLNTLTKEENEILEHISSEDLLKITKNL